MTMDGHAMTQGGVLAVRRWNLLVLAVYKRLSCCYREMLISEKPVYKGYNELCYTATGAKFGLQPRPTHSRET